MAGRSKAPVVGTWKQAAPPPTLRPCSPAATAAEPRRSRLVDAAWVLAAASAGLLLSDAVTPRSRPPPLPPRLPPLPSAGAGASGRGGGQTAAAVVGLAAAGAEADVPRAATPALSAATAAPHVKIKTTWVKAPNVTGGPLPRVPDPFEGPPECPACAGADPCSKQGPRELHWTVQPEAEWPPPDRCADEPLAELCSVLRRIAGSRREVLMAVANSKAPGLWKFIDNVMKAVGIGNFIITALDKELATKLQQKGVPFWFRPNKAQGNHKVSAEKFAIVRDYIDVGCSVLLSDTDVVYFRNPFDHIGHDHDVETMVDGWDWETAHGFTDTVDDPTLGSYGRKLMRTSRLQAFNSGLWYIAATQAGRRLMDIMALRMREEETWDQAAYFMELLFPSRDAHLACGASVRVLSPLCFMNSKVMMRIVRPRLMKLQGKEKLAAARRHGPVALHANYHQDKPHKMEQAEQLWLQGRPDALDSCTCSYAQHCGCGAGTSSVAELEREWQYSVNDGMAMSREWINGPAALGRGRGERQDRRDPLEVCLAGSAAPQRNPGRHPCAPLQPWGGLLPRSGTRELQRLRRAQCPPAGPGLSGARRLLCNAASGRAEVMLVTAGGGGAAELEAFKLLIGPGGVAKLGLEDSTVIAALSDEVEEAARAANLASVRLERRGSPAAAKWSALVDLLLVGVSVLVVDAATVLLASPWAFLYRDADVEAASDGWDDRTAYGYDHVVDDKYMGWSRYCHGVRIGARDPGFAYFQATREAAVLAGRVLSRCAHSGEEEGAAFTAELFEPSHGPHLSAGAVPRTMNYLCFANSKTIWRHWRQSAVPGGPLHGLRPVAVRMRYHPPGEAAERGRAVLAAFGAAAVDLTALQRLPLQGGHRGAGSAADKAACASGTAVDSSSPAGPAGVWSWSGNTPVRFLAGGVFEHPWGKGHWAALPPDPASGQQRVRALFAGAVHVLRFESGGTFVSERCGDGDVVVGRLTGKDPSST